MGRGGGGVVVVRGRSVGVYRVGRDDVEGGGDGTGEGQYRRVVVPMITRVLAAGGVVVGPAVGKKRQKAGGGAAGAEAGGSSAVFVDGVSRGYIVQSSEKGSARVVVMDLLYGSVLWSGVVQGCDGVVTQVRLVLLEGGSGS